MEKGGRRGKRQTTTMCSQLMCEYTCMYLQIYTYRHTVHVYLSTCTCVCWLGHLDVWEVLAGHKRSLTHRPSSQGWAFRCPVIDCLFVCLICRCVALFRMWVGVSFFPF